MFACYARSKFLSLDGNKWLHKSQKVMEKESRGQQQDKASAQQICSLNLSMTKGKRKYKTKRYGTTKLHPKYTHGCPGPQGTIQ
jgi:hypothetical protein